MDREDAPSQSDADESGRGGEDEVDDRFRAVMEGLRTAIPGVMVLFSFLLILPLQASFPEVGGLNKVVFYVAFSCSATASVLMIAPSVHQLSRAPFSGIKRQSASHVMYATKMAIAGTVFLLVAVTAVVYLVSSLIFTDPLAVGASVAITVLASWAWFYLPLVKFNHTDED